MLVLILPVLVVIPNFRYIQTTSDFMLIFFLKQTASFLSDIGGLMGMWIGISVLTVVELLELIVTLFITIFKLYSKKRDRVVNIKNASDMAEAD